IRAVAEADADRIVKTGVAEAIAIDEQVKASGGPRFQMTREVMESLATAVKDGRIPIVPRVLIQGDAAKEHGGALQSMLALLLTDWQAADGTHGGGQPSRVQALKDQLRAAADPGRRTAPATDGAEGRPS